MRVRPGNYILEAGMMKCRSRGSHLGDIPPPGRLGWRGAFRGVSLFDLDAVMA
jgi:hypothetical protein